MHYVQAKSILTRFNEINLYRGCQHGCIYCDSRCDCYYMNHEFTDIEVKQNSLHLLEKSLRRMNEKKIIGMGSMSDPYIPLEKDLKYTRRALELIYKYGHGFRCITKSDLILRDIDLIKKVNEKTRAIICVTVTSMDDDVSKIIEPTVMPTTQRFKIMDELSKEDIPVFAWIKPVLPYITDSVENISQIVDNCIEANVTGIYCPSATVSLRDGNREYFYKKLDNHFPGLKEKYIGEFGDKPYAISPNNVEILNIIRKKSKQNNLMYKQKDLEEFFSKFPEKEFQSTLF